MAFSTIGWNGYGIINSCESATGWAELGGGTFSVNPDFYLQGSASIGSTYAAKSGYTYYTAGTPLDFTTTYANQKVYIWIAIQSTAALETLANDGLAIAVGSANNAIRHFRIAGSDSNNGWSSGWKLFVINPTLSGTSDNGTPNMTAVDTYGLWMDVVASVRADSIFIDEFAVADGMQCHSGSGTMDEIIEYTYRTLGTRVIGVMTENGRFNYALGKFTVGNSSSATADTILTVTDKVIGFNETEYYNGSAWVSTADTTSLYNIVHLAKHASYATELHSNNASWFGNAKAWLTFSKDAGAKYYFNGGTIERIKAFTHDADFSTQNMVINNVESINVTSGTFQNNTISASQPLVVSSTISGISIKNYLTVGATSSSFNYFSNCYLERGTGGVGIDISGTEITTNTTMSWNNTSSGYSATAGQETIKVNVANGVTLTINNNTGDTIYYDNIGSGTVNIVTGQRTKTFTVSPTPSTYEYRIYSVTSPGSLSGAVEVQGTETYTSASFGYTYSYAANSYIAVQVLDHTDIYKEKIGYYTLPDADTADTIELEIDTND